MTRDYSPATEMPTLIVARVLRMSFDQLTSRYNELTEKGRGARTWDEDYELDKIGNVLCGDFDYL